MGHVPSKEVSSKPFLADLQTAKGGVDRLIAASVTLENFPSVEDPLFKQFVALRCDPSVLHWFNVQEPKNRTTLPPPPDPEFLFQKHVVEPTEQLEKGIPVEDYMPIPIALFRLASSNATKSQTVDQWAPIAGGAPFETLRDIVAAGEEVQMVGYLGCRGTKNPGGPVLSVFLDKTFWNEAKSISIFQIGCKCYEHNCSQLGIVQPKWPLRLKARCLDTNLPTLRLIQAIFRQYQQTGVTVEHKDTHVTLAADPAVLASICTQLCGSVSSETFPGTRIHRRFYLETQRPGPAPIPITPFDHVVECAKNAWKENNALVVAAKKDIENAEKEALDKQRREENAAAIQRGEMPPHPQPPSRGSTPKTMSASQTPASVTPKSSPMHFPSGPSIINGVAGPHGGQININAKPGALGGVNVPPGVMGGASNLKNRGQMASPGYTSIYAPPQVATAVNSLLPGHSQNNLNHNGAPTGGGNNTNNNHNSNNSGTSKQPPAQTSAMPPPMPQQQIMVQQSPPTVTPTIPQPPTQPAIRSVKLPFQAQATMLLPTSNAGVLQPLQVHWAETDLELKLSTQRSQHPGMLFEVAKRPESGAINVLTGTGVTSFPLPDPCYINVNPGTPVFVQF